MGNKMAKRYYIAYGSNAYTGVRIREIEWRGRTYRIVDVDGMTCQIERL